MNHWLIAHRNACALALRRLASAPLNMLLAVLGIGIALALPAGGQLVLNELAALSRGTSAAPQITVFMKVNAERKATQSIEASLKDRGDVARTHLLPREETLARMKTIDGLADVIGALPKNPFPDAVVVTPSSDSPAALEKLAVEARQWRDVEHVQIDADWARRLAAFVKLANTAVVLLAAMLGVGLVSIIFNTVRLQVLTRQAEVEVSRLLGATDGFIRRPFLWHGGLLGLLGGAAAWLIVAGAMLWLRDPVAELAALYGLTITLAPPSSIASALIFCTSGLLGWLGAALSMRQHLHS